MIVIVLPDIAEEDNLLASARRADTDAQRRIYETYFPPIFNFIRLRISDTQQAQDIAADVFLDFFVALKGNRPPQKSLRAWLFRVARNKIYDHYGKRDRLPTTTLDDWMAADYDADPANAFMKTHSRERVKQVLGMLTDDHQEVLILRFGQALSLQETADIMNKSVSAVKSLQFRAVDRLRQLLGADDG